MILKGLSFIFFGCHEEILDTFFKVSGLSMEKTRVLAGERFDKLMSQLFTKIEEYSETTLQIS